MSRLHLLHGDPAAQSWTDITSQVSLYVTHVYAVFYITHFSWCDFGRVLRVVRVHCGCFFTLCVVPGTGCGTPLSDSFVEL